MSGLEEVENTRSNVAQYDPGGDMKETPNENSAAEYADIKKLLEYLTKVNKEKNYSIKEQNKVLRDSLTSMKEALINDIREVKTGIEKSLKSSELETQRMNRGL
jgi:hypothetical protein